MRDALERLDQLHPGLIINMVAMRWRLGCRCQNGLEPFREKFTALVAEWQNTQNSSPALY